MCFYSVFLFKTTAPLFLFYSFQIIDRYLLFKNAQKLILAKLFLISHLRKQIHTKVLRKLVFGIELILKESITAIFSVKIRIIYNTKQLNGFYMKQHFRESFSQTEYRNIHFNSKHLKLYIQTLLCKNPL